MGKKQFNIKPKTWPKEYTFEEFKRLNPNINENLLINYYNKYLQEYAENHSRFIKHFEDNKKLLANNLQEVKERYDQSQYFLKMYYSNLTDATAGQPGRFTPTDIPGLTHWFKAETSYITTEDVLWNNLQEVTPENTVQQVVSWSSAVGNSVLTKGAFNNPSGYYASHKNSVAVNRGRSANGGNTGGARMVLSDDPRFGAFTYFAVFELNTTSGVTVNWNDGPFETSSILHTRTNTGASPNGSLHNSVLIETPANDGSGAIKKIRVGFANNTPQFSLEPDLALSGADVFITASLDEYIEADNKISGSGLRKAFVDAINNGFGSSNIANFSASEQGLITGDSALTFMRATPISSVTNLPWDGNFYNGLLDCEPIKITNHFSESLIKSDTNGFNVLGNYHGMWREGPAGGLDNSFFLVGEEIDAQGNTNLLFDMSVSSSGGNGGSSTSISAISNDPKDNTKFVFIVHKDAIINSTVKVLINNKPSFPEGTSSGSLELETDDLFLPKMFGQVNGQFRSLNGHVYEMGFYTGSLSDNDLTQLYYYLGLKYNVPGYDGKPKLLPYNWPDPNYYN